MQMKKLFLATLIIAAWSPLSYGQQIVRPADCIIPFSFTAAGSSGGNGAPFFDNRGSQCQTWTLSYQSYGFSAVSLQFDKAPDSTGAPGSFTVWTDLLSGSLPLTTTTYTQITGYKYAPWVRVTLNSKTGTGRIYGSLLGYRNTSGDASAGSGGGSVSISGQPVTVSCTTTNCPGGGPSLPGNAVPVVDSYETLVQGATASLMTGTASTQVIAGVASNYLYITSCHFSNNHASVDTLEVLQNGSGGTALNGAGNLNPHGAGNNVTYNRPLKVGTLGNGLYVANSTTGSSTTVDCQGFASGNSY
jgi:hypothetical protein